jgi:hypothetical protein
MKKCTKCGIEKQENEFHKDKKTKDGPAIPVLNENTYN